MVEHARRKLAAALRRWITLLRPSGRLTLIEGCWNSATEENTYVEGSGSLPWNGGVTAKTLASTLQPLVADLRIEPLIDPELWGRVINDEIPGSRNPHTLVAQVTNSTRQ